jgi:hypothetical protein
MRISKMNIESTLSDHGERLNALYDRSSPKESQVKACEVRPALGAPCWPLYYATSTYRLKRILRENCLRTEGDLKIALTTERSLAEYWAHLDVFGDRHDHPDEETHPVVLVLDGDTLIEDHYDLQRYSEPDWDEIACWGDIEALDEVLIDIQQIPEQHASGASNP